MGLARSLRIPAALLVATLAAAWPAAQSSHITAAEAKAHAGEVQNVCGHVVGATYALRSRGQPTFVNLDKPYPNQIFTIVIWGSDRPKFGTPEIDYRDKNICVTGKITIYRGVAEIVANDPKQVSVATNR